MRCWFNSTPTRDGRSTRASYQPARPRCLMASTIFARRVRLVLILMMMRFRMAAISTGDASKPRARLIDPSLKIAVEIRADAAFSDFVVFAPPKQPGRRARAIPCAPDAFNLAARGVAAGMRELAPGQTFEAGFEIRLNVP